jgi:hypothetical protein
MDALKFTFIANPFFDIRIPIIFVFALYIFLHTSMAFFPPSYLGHRRAGGAKGRRDSSTINAKNRNSKKTR